MSFPSTDARTTATGAPAFSAPAEAPVDGAVRRRGPVTIGTGRSILAQASRSAAVSAPGVSPPTISRWASNGPASGSSGANSGGRSA